MVQIPKADKGLVCPLHKKDMSKVCHTCPWWVKLRGPNPNDDKVIIDHWSCSISFLPFLMLENAQQSRQAGAATESMRNEIVGRMDQQIMGGVRRLS